jgi:hypothetical protein
VDYHSSTDSDGGWGSTSSATSGAAKSEEAAVARLQLTGRQRDELLSAALAVGDRVSVTVQQKPPRYGRKKRQYTFSFIIIILLLLKRSNKVRKWKSCHQKKEIEHFGVTHLLLLLSLLSLL